MQEKGRYPCVNAGRAVGKNDLKALGSSDFGEEAGFRHEDTPSTV